MSASSKYIIDSQTLTDIADAIRTKTGDSNPIAVEDMATEIGNISGGGGGGPYYATGDATQFMISAAAKTAYNSANNPEIILNNVSGLSSAFASDSALYGGNAPRVDYSNIIINSVSGTAIPLQNMFQFNDAIIALPTLNCSLPTGGVVNNLFATTNIKEIPQDWIDNVDFTGLNAATTTNCNSWFYECRWLRTIPEEWMPYLYNSATSGSNTKKFWSNLFNVCISLDAVDDFPAPNLTYTSNMFSNTFYNNCHLKSFTFATNNGTPYVRAWTNQTIDLSNQTGYFNSYIAQYYGFDASKQISDAASYDALKNDPDAFTGNVAYSRFDHDSAVDAINSLPDTSAVSLPSAPTNVIKFLGASGSSTDAGAISTLTAAEIQVATDKGWTVTLV